MKAEELKKYKDNLYSSLSRDLDAFEKNFILISTGILAFSITFLKEIVKIDEATWLPLLFIGWLLLLISVGLMMLTFLSSVNGNNHLWKLVDTFLIDKRKFDNTDELTEDEVIEIKSKINEAFFEIKNRLKTIRSLAVLAFIIGFSFFSFFVGHNLYNENNKNKEVHIFQDEKKGTVIQIGNTKIITKDSVIINPR